VKSVKPEPAFDLRRYGEPTTPTNYTVLATFPLPAEVAAELNRSLVRTAFRLWPAKEPR